MGVHQPKQIVLPPLFPPSRYQLSLILHSGTACRRRWLRQVMEPQAVFLSLSLSLWKTEKGEMAERACGNLPAQVNAAER